MKSFSVSRGLQLFFGALLPLAWAISFSPALHAQTSSEPAKSMEAQSRIERARALIAAHQLETAASELESVRGANQDYSIRNITSVMLMSIYLESGNYGRAEALLEETFRARSAQNNESVYFALAGQAVNGARTHLARYRSFGISISDSNLPAEATNDLDRMRSLLERMVAQAKEISTARQAYDSLSLLEDVLGLRLSLAKDSEDQARWETEYANAREVQASSQTQIASLGGAPGLATLAPRSILKLNPTTNPKKPATEGLASDKTPLPAQLAAAPLTLDANLAQQTQTAPEAPIAVSKANQSTDKLKTVTTGSLNAKATKKVVPRYPPLAKQTGTKGVVRVYIVVDETGKVVEVSRSEGPIILRQAAEEAARQWSFSALLGINGPVPYSGYIDFNFTL